MRLYSILLASVYSYLVQNFIALLNCTIEGVLLFFSLNLLMAAY